MTDEVAKVGIGITANDNTAKGFAAVEKRAEKSAKRVGELNRRTLADHERATGRSAKAIVGSLGKIEQATAKAFGSKSLTAGLARCMGAVGEAASAMGEGFIGAATAGGGLAKAAGAVTVAVGGTVAVLAAAAYAAFKFTDSWAKGAAGLSRTAEIIGVSTKALTEFAAAAERAGVDKGTATGTLGSLSQTLNDARYGRNTQALEVLRRLGVGMKLNADGTVNTEAMLPAIADALKRQNSSGRRTAAHALGIADAALPAFTQGGNALAGDMRDADKTAVVIDDGVGAMARRIARKGVLVGQMKDREIDYQGRSLAPHVESGFDAILDGAHVFDSAVHGDFKPAAEKINRAADKMAKATGTSRAAIIGGAVGGIPGFVAGTIYDRIEHLGERSRQNQVSPAGAVGVMQLMPGTARTVAGRLGIPFDAGRFKHDATYNRMLGRAYLDWLLKHYGGDETLATAAYNAGEGAVDHWISGTPYKDSKGRRLQYHLGDPRRGELSDAEWASRIPYKETRNYVHRVIVEFKNAPKGTRATVHSPGGAVSHAMAN